MCKKYLLNFFFTFNYTTKMNTFWIFRYLYIHFPFHFDKPNISLLTASSIRNFHKNTWNSSVPFNWRLETTISYCNMFGLIAISIIQFEIHFSFRHKLLFQCLFWNWHISVDILNVTSWKKATFERNSIIKRQALIWYAPNYLPFKCFWTIHNWCVQFNFKQSSFFFYLLEMKQTNILNSHTIKTKQKNQKLWNNFKPSETSSLLLSNRFMTYTISIKTKMYALLSST